MRASTVFTLALSFAASLSGLSAQTSHVYGPRAQDQGITVYKYQDQWYGFPSWTYVGINASSQGVVVYRLFLRWNYDNSSLPQGASITQVQLQFNASRHSFPPPHFGFTMHEVGLPVDQASASLYYSPADGNKVLTGETYTSGSIEQFNATESSGSLVNAIQNALNSGRKFVTFGFVLNPESGPDGWWELSSVSLTISFTAPQYYLTVMNSFGAGTVLVDGGSYGSGSSIPFNWNTGHTLTAIDGQSYGNYIQRFQNWTKAGDPNPDASNPKTVSVIENATYTANFLNEYNVTLQNNFVGVGNTGMMNVKRPGETQYTQYALPTSAFPVVQYQTIDVQAFNQVYNGIDYTFSQWSDGNTSQSRTFAPTSHLTYTANFTGRPVPVANLTATANNQEGNVKVNWSEHPNANVSQYRIWRQVEAQSPTLRATVARGTTNWTDMEYTYTNFPRDIQLKYDARAFYSIESTTANPQWVLTYGTQDIQQGRPDVAVAVLPTENRLSSFPNPFNPATRIAYDVKEDAIVTLVVYDMLGRRVAELANWAVRAGRYTVEWEGNDENGRQVASGVYVARITIAPNSGGEIGVLTHRMMLVR